MSSLRLSIFSSSLLLNECRQLKHMAKQHNNKIAFFAVLSSHGPNTGFLLLVECTTTCLEKIRFGYYMPIF